MLAALIVGGYTAWYMGVRTGVVAAIIVAVGLIASSFIPIPGVSIGVYALVLGWCAALFFFGRQIAGTASSRGGYKASVMSDLGTLAAKARKFMGRR